MKNLELMIDLEFMGKPPTAAITSIGAVLIDVDTLTIYDSWSAHVSLQSSVKAGMTLDAETVLWWMHAEEDARIALTRGQESAQQLDEALRHFDQWLKSNLEWSWINLGKVWGYGATSDNLIISHAFKVCDMTLPWTFREDRCFRTFMDDHQDKWVNYGTAHDAADDAMAQALTLIEVYRSQPGRVVEELPSPPPPIGPAKSTDPLFDSFDDDLPF